MYSYKGLTTRTKAKYCNYGKQYNYAQVVQLEIAKYHIKTRNSFITVKTLVF